LNNRECSYNKQANRVGPNVDPCGTYKNDMKKMSDNREERLKYRFVVIKLGCSLRTRPLSGNLINSSRLLCNFPVIKSCLKRA
jgi:hypothetical protein